MIILDQLQNLLEFKYIPNEFKSNSKSDAIKINLSD